MILEKILNNIEGLVLIYDKAGDLLFCNKKNNPFDSYQHLVAISSSCSDKCEGIQPTLVNKCDIKSFEISFQNKNDAICFVVNNHRSPRTSTKLSNLQQANQELQTVIDSSYDGIGIIDHTGTLIKVNKSYLRITNLKEEESGVGRRIEDLEREGVVSQAVGLMVLKQKKTVTIKQKIKTGKTVLITGSPVFDEAGNVVRVIANIRDMTELNYLRKELEKSRNLSGRHYSELKEVRGYEELANDIISTSYAMKRALNTAITVAKFDSSVLISGESGVGKEIVGEVIHNFSKRVGKPFIKINCGAIPENLLESELFGYIKGAFTGANREGKIGTFQAAEGGTLMLDEIGEMPLHMQVKLLRVLQEKEVTPVGSTKPVKIDVRILAVSNRCLHEMVAQGLFRKDLFYRLNVVPIILPPLSERRDDIIPLAQHFVKKVNKKFALNKHLCNEVLEIIENKTWPGNVRELEMTIERLLVTTPEDKIKIHHLPVDFYQDHDPQVSTPQNGKLDLKINDLMPMKEAVEMVEKCLLSKAMAQCSSTRKAARELGIDHSTVVRKTRKYKIKCEAAVG